MENISMKVSSLILILAVLGFAACSKPEPPQYVGIDDMKVLSIGLAESMIGLNIKMYNPNRSRMQLKSANMEIFVNNQLLGTTLLDSLIQIPKRDTFAVPVKVTVTTLSSATKLLQSLSDTSVVLRVAGTARLGKGGIFVNYPLAYEGRQTIR